MITDRNGARYHVDDNGDEKFIGDTPKPDSMRQEIMSMTVRCIAKQEIWIDVDEETKEYDAEIHIHGKDLFEVLDGLSIIRDRLNRLNGLN